MLWNDQCFTTPDFIYRELLLKDAMDTPKTQTLKLSRYHLSNFYHLQTKFAKVMFSQVFVCPKGGGSASRGVGRPPPITYYGVRSTSGQYASYCNAFLFLISVIWTKNIHINFLKKTSTEQIAWHLFFHFI